MNLKKDEVKKVEQNVLFISKMVAYYVEFAYENQEHLALAIVRLAIKSLQERIISKENPEKRNLKIQSAK